MEGGVSSNSYQIPVIAGEAPSIVFHELESTTAGKVPNT